MIVNIKEIQRNKIEAIIDEYDRIGGSFRFSFFTFDKNHDGQLPKSNFNAHLTVARQSLEKITYEMNFDWNKIEGIGKRTGYLNWCTNHSELEKSGTKISIEEFLGPHWNYELNMPIIHSKSGNDKSLTYQTTDGTIKYHNADLEIERKKYFELYDNGGSGFISGLIDPVYSLNIDNETQILGEFIDKLTNYLFDDITQLEIFKWSCDCHPVFGDGKEWWGTYFFTVYNPHKNWYIGLIASETD